MDTTAAAELGMGEPEGAAFWDAGPPGPDQWGDHGDDDLLDDDDLSWDRPGLHVGAAVPHDFQQASHSSFGRGRAPGAEPSQKTSRTMPDGIHQHSNGGPSQHSFSGGSSGHGGGTTLGRGNSSAAGAGSPNFGTVGSSPSGAGAVGRGRGMGSIFYKTKLCSRFRSGNCPYNTNCNFAHGMEELRKPPPGWEEFVASQELPPPPPSQPGGQGGSGAAAGSTDSQVRFHKTRPCKKYFGEGNCPYGEKCNFLHDEQSVPRAVREAREAAVAASGAVIAASPKVETLTPTTNGNIKETGGGDGSTPAGSATRNARPSNWKTRLCNKWETTGHCPFGDKCHFAHGSDELQRYGGGLPDSNAPALSGSKSGGTPSRDSFAVSSHQRHQGVAYSARSGSKGNTNWRGPNEISTIYGDWWVEDDDWQFGGTTTSHESTEHEGDVWREAQRRTPLPAPSSLTPKTVPFFRRINSLEPSRQSLSLINGSASISQQDGGVHKQTLQYEGMNAMGKEGIYGSLLQPEHGWRSELRWLVALHPSCISCSGVMLK